MGFKRQRPDDTERVNIIQDGLNFRVRSSHFAAGDRAELMQDLHADDAALGQ